MYAPYVQTVQNKQLIIFHAATQKIVRVMCMAVMLS